MKKQVIDVPVENPLILFAVMGKKLDKSFIFIRENVLLQLAKDADRLDTCDGSMKLIWKKTKHTDKSVIEVSTNSSKWIRITSISASVSLYPEGPTNISFTEEPDPESIYFFK